MSPVSLLVGCPVILPPRDDVLASWTHPTHVIVVNGAFGEWDMAADGYGLWTPERPPEAVGQNIGVAKSWNLIFEFARQKTFSHVALMSQGAVLDGGTERLAELVDEYADWRGMLTDFAWHVIVLSVKLWEQIGPFDEIFSPAFYEDSDYVRRLFVAGLHTGANPIPKVGRDLLGGTETFAATIGLIPEDTYGKNGERYRAKWGGMPFEEKWTVPYDPTSVNPANNWSSSEVDHLGRPKGN